jgi:hyperosmotically inducible periplasmic protein
MSRVPKFSLAALAVMSLLPLSTLASDPVAIVDAITGGEQDCERLTGPSVVPVKLVEQQQLLPEDKLRCHGHTVAHIHFFKTGAKRDVEGDDAWTGVGNPAPLPSKGKSINLPGNGEGSRLGRIAQASPSEGKTNKKTTADAAIAVKRAEVGGAASDVATANSVGTIVDDGSITTKVKAELLGAKDVKSTHIHVKTRAGVVWLTGTVPSTEDKNAVEKTVKNVSGVASVKNHLKVAEQ